MWLPTGFRKLYIVVMYVATSRLQEAVFLSVTKYKVLFSYMYGTKCVQNHQEIQAFKENFSSE